MNPPTDKNGFSYSYSAKDQAEIRRIREKYAPEQPTEDTLTRLRRLDAEVTRAAEVVALILGVLGALIFGSGLSLMLSDLAAKLFIAEWAVLPLAIGLALIGGALAASAFPVYRAMVRRKKRQVGPEILQLTEELLQ